MFRRITVAIVAMTLALLATDPLGVGWGSAPASAHDQLVSSTPEPDERLAAGPAEVRLEFTADVLDIGALVFIVDGSGTDWAASATPSIAGTIVTVPLLPDMPEAGYQVRWRVVSSDGHPISGVIPFTIGDAAPLETAVQGQLPEEREAEVQNSQEQDAIGRTALIGAGGAAAAVALFVLATALRHARRTRRAGTPPDGDDPTQP